MEYRKTVVDGIEYNLFTDEELEDLIVLIRNEKQLINIRNGKVEGIEASEFRKLIKEEYGF